MLTKFQEDFLNKTDKLMEEHNLMEEDYSVIELEEFNLQTGSKMIILKLQLKDDENIVKKLRKIGWKIDHRYYSNGSPLLYSEDGEYPTEFEGDVEMIQLAYK